MRRRDMTYNPFIARKAQLARQIERQEAAKEGKRYHAHYQGYRSGAGDVCPYTDHERADAWQAGRLAAQDRAADRLGATLEGLGLRGEHDRDGWCRLVGLCRAAGITGHNAPDLVDRLQHCQPEPVTIELLTEQGPALLPPASTNTH